MEPLRTGTPAVETIDMTPVTDAYGNTMYASGNDALGIALERLAACVAQEPAACLQALGWVAGGLAGLWILCSLIPTAKPPRGTQGKKKPGKRK